MLAAASSIVSQSGKKGEAGRFIPPTAVGGFGKIALPSIVVLNSVSVCCSAGSKATGDHQATDDAEVVPPGKDRLLPVRGAVVPFWAGRA